MFLFRLCTKHASYHFHRTWFRVVFFCNCMRSLIFDMIYLLTAIGLSLGGSSTIHIYTQTVHGTTQLTALVGRLSGIRTHSGHTNWEEYGPCPVFARYTMAFALQLRKKHGKTSVDMILKATHRRDITPKYPRTDK